MIDYLSAANKTLQDLWGPKHKPIIQSEIGAVYSRDLLSINADAKTRKGINRGYLTGILYLAPHTLSGANLCPMATAGCKASCLFTAGRGAFYAIQRARMIKTLAYLYDKPAFIVSLKRSIGKVVKQADRKRLIPCIRLNGTSDIPWESISDIIQSFPDLQFYDYTKMYSRLLRSRPGNYHLTYSGAETLKPETLANLLKFRVANVAIVFDRALPVKYLGHPVLPGDKTDLRFLDQSGFVIGLVAKGKAKRDLTGFKVNPNINPNERT